MEEQTLALANEICNEMIAQTVPLYEEFPLIARYGRPLFSDADKYGFTSIQTYQIGELLTYSKKTLELLKQHLFTMKAEGRNMAREMVAHSICSCGFSSLEEAEAFLSAKQKQTSY